MGGVFTCGACKHAQRGGKRFPVTEDNVGGVRARLESSGRAVLAATVTVGMVLCTLSRSVKVSGKPATVPACISEADQAALENNLIGLRVTKLLLDAPGELVDAANATVADQPPPLQGDMDQDDGRPGAMTFRDGMITGFAAGEPGSYTADFETAAGVVCMELSATDAKEGVQAFIRCRSCCHSGHGHRSWAVECSCICSFGITLADSNHHFIILCGDKH